jgi:hypothetical protein
MTRPVEWRKCGGLATVVRVILSPFAVILSAAKDLLFAVILSATKDLLWRGLKSRSFGFASG